MIIKNNLEFAQHLETLPVEERLVAYGKLLPDLKFKVKSFGGLMKRYEAWKKNHGRIDTEN